MKRFTNEWLYAEDYVYGKPALEAGPIIANVWCENKKSGIDMWGYDEVYPEFIESFLKTCQQNGCLEEACEIEWAFHVCPGPAEWETLYDCVPKWIEAFKLTGSVPREEPLKDGEWLQKLSGDDNDEC